MMKMHRNIILLICAALLPTFSLAQGNAEADSLKMRLHDLYTEFVDQEIRENYDSAYVLIKQCYDMDSTQAEIIYQKALYDNMFQIQKNDSAANHIPHIISEIERSYAKDPQNRKYAKSLFTLYNNTNDTLKLCSILEDLSVLDKSNEQYVSMLISIYETTGQYDKQLSAIDRLEQMAGVTTQTELARVSAIWKQKGERKAMAYWQKLVRKRPDEPDYHIYMGKMILSENAPYTAAVHFKRALKLAPLNDEVRYLYIKCYDWHGSEKKARKMKLEVINDPSASPELKTQLLSDMIEEYEALPNGTQQLLALFKKALSYPHEGEDMTQLYAAYLRMQKCDADSISRAMQEVLGTEPTNTMAQYYLLGYFSEKDSVPAIIEVCRNAIKHDTPMLEFHYYLAIANYQQGDMEQSKQTLLSAVANRRFANNTKMYADCYSLLGNIYHKQDSILQCYNAFEECLRWNPDDDEVLNNYAYYLSIEGGDLQKAERMSKKAIEAQPERGTYLDTYAWILFKLKRYPEALKYINKALADYSSTGGVVYEHAGDIYALNNEIEAAIAYWELAKGQEEVSNKLEQKLAEKRYIPED